MTLRRLRSEARKPRRDQISVRSPKWRDQSLTDFYLSLKKLQIIEI